MEERYHATTQNRFYPDMSNVNKNITVEAKLISPPTYVRYSFPPWLYVVLLHFPHDLSKWSSPSFSSTAFQKIPRHFWPSRSVQMSASHKAVFQCLAFTSYYLKFRCNLGKAFLLLNATVTVAILDLISRVHSARMFLQGSMCRAVFPNLFDVAVPLTSLFISHGTPWGKHLFFKVDLLYNY